MSKNESTLFEKYVQLQVDYRNARADVDALTARVVELEQVVSEAASLMEKYHGTIESMYGLSYSLRAPILPVIEAWQQRARVLLHEGQSDPAKEEPQ